MRMQLDRFSDEVLAKVKAWGLRMPAVLFMVNHSAPVTHDHGNKRYEEYVFNVEDDWVTGIWREAEFM